MVGGPLAVRWPGYGVTDVILFSYYKPSPMRWPRCQGRRSAVARLDEIAGSNPAGGLDVCCEYCVLSGRNLWVGLITRPEESYRVWCVVV